MPLEIEFLQGLLARCPRYFIPALCIIISLIIIIIKVVRLIAIIVIIVMVILPYKTEWIFHCIWD
jgi:hypothetical protein